MLIVQQGSIFWGAMMWSQAGISNLNVPSCVTDPGIEQVDEVKPLARIAVDRVRRIDGVEWAGPTAQGSARACLVNEGYLQITLTRMSATSVAINAAGSLNASLPGSSGSGAYSFAGSTTPPTSVALCSSPASRCSSSGFEMGSRLLISGGRPLVPPLHCAGHSRSVGIVLRPRH